MHMRSGDVEVRKTLPYFPSPSVLRKYNVIEEATFYMFTSYTQICKFFHEIIYCKAVP